MRPNRNDKSGSARGMGFRSLMNQKHRNPAIREAPWNSARRSDFSPGLPYHRAETPHPSTSPRHPRWAWAAWTGGQRWLWGQKHLPEKLKDFFTVKTNEQTQIEPPLPRMSGQGNPVFKSQGTALQTDGNGWEWLLELLGLYALHCR